MKHVSAKEVYGSLCSIGENKAPGADGFSSRFFKSTWHLIGDKVVKAIQEFFISGTY